MLRQSLSLSSAGWHWAGGIGSGHIGVNEWEMAHFQKKLACDWGGFLERGNVQWHNVGQALARFPAVPVLRCL